MHPDVYLFVISSINHPIYRKIQTKRRKVLGHYNIPYSVLINHNDPDIQSTAEPTLTPLNDEEIFYNGGGYNPYMAQKFLMAVKMLFRSHKRFEDVPNYIIRINATVYVHFPSLFAMLNDDNFPRTRVLAGVDCGVFVQGMVMVFSKDVLANMLNDPRMYDKEIMRHNDDVSLTMLAKPYSEKVDWARHLCMMRECPTTDKGVYKPEKIGKEKWMFRICEFEQDRHYDAVNWDVLMKHFGEDITTPSLQQQRPPYRLWFWFLSLVIVILAVAFLHYRRKGRHRPINTTHRHRLLRELA